MRVKEDGPLLTKAESNPRYTKLKDMITLRFPEGANHNALQRDRSGDPRMSGSTKKKKLTKPWRNKRKPRKEESPSLATDLSIRVLGHQNSADDSSVRKVSCDEGIALKDDAEFSKYFSMLKIGIPVGAVKNALQRDGKDPSIIDLDPEKPVATQLHKHNNLGSTKESTVSKENKKRVRRKQVYWTTIEAHKIHKQSIWSLCKSDADMSSLKYDSAEFEKLFTESISDDANRKQGNCSGRKMTKQPKGAKFIDSKRGMNGGIVLAHLKTDYSKLAEMVDKMYV